MHLLTQLQPQQTTYSSVLHIYTGQLNGFSTVSIKAYDTAILALSTGLSDITAY